MMRMPTVSVLLSTMVSLNNTDYSKEPSKQIKHAVLRYLKFRIMNETARRLTVANLYW
jgi:hypothetical protein